MKERLLDLVVCPACRGSLELEVQEREGPEIREGSLHCRPCAAVYPIRRKIPRFVAMDPGFAVYLCRIPLLGGRLQVLAPISMSRRWRERWLDTFDWYTPAYQWKHEYPEVYRWFVTGGFEQVEIFDFPICMRGVRSRRSR